MGSKQTHVVLPLGHRKGNEAPVKSLMIINILRPGLKLETHHSVIPQ